mmetsp:Transcript_63502/g.151417  ORF Transcript_63502/g.151417 Transcript_63502/m.151417 type:complete len:226 (-) Transcript_63502:1547-2224(-)
MPRRPRRGFGARRCCGHILVGLSWARLRAVLQEVVECLVKAQMEQHVLELHPNLAALVLPGGLLSLDGPLHRKSRCSSFRLTCRGPGSVRRLGGGGCEVAEGSRHLGQLALHMLQALTLQGLELLLELLEALLLPRLQFLHQGAVGAGVLQRVWGRRVADLVQGCYHREPALCHQVLAMSLQIALYGDAALLEQLLLCLRSGADGVQAVCFVERGVGLRLKAGDE